MSNIFEGAKFGAPFKAKNGEKVFFLGRLDDGSVPCLVGNEKSYGFSILEEEDIVSKWVEQVDEDKLCVEKCDAALRYYPVENEGGRSDFASIRRVAYGDGYEAGYRKALER